MRRVMALIPVVAMTIAGCATVPATEDAPMTWLAVHGPVDWMPPEAMSLEIGDAAWSITAQGGSGVVTPFLASPVAVRLVGVESCREYAAFQITPGSAWIIRFDANDSIAVVDAAGLAREMGPALVEGPPSECEPAG